MTATASKRFRVVAEDLTAYTEDFSTSGEAMNAAVRKFRPNLLKPGDMRRAWFEMKDEGYRLHRIAGMPNNDLAAIESRAYALDAAPADPINPPETDSKLIVPSGECWRRACQEGLYPELLQRITKRAREIAREGK